MVYQQILFWHILKNILGILGRTSPLQQIYTDDEVLNSLRVIEHRVRVEDVQVQEEVGLLWGAAVLSLAIGGQIHQCFNHCGLTQH